MKWRWKERPKQVVFVWLFFLGKAIFFSPNNKRKKNTLFSFLWSLDDVWVSSVLFCCTKNRSGIRNNLTINFATTTHSKQKDQLLQWLRQGKSWFFHVQAVKLANKHERATKIDQSNLELKFTIFFGQRHLELQTSSPHKLWRHVRIFLRQESFWPNKTNQKKLNKEKKRVHFLQLLLSEKTVAFVLTQKYPHNWSQQDKVRSRVDLNKWGVICIKRLIQWGGIVCFAKRPFLDFLNRSPFSTINCVDQHFHDSTTSTKAQITKIRPVKVLDKKQK